MIYVQRINAVLYEKGIEDGFLYSSGCGFEEFFETEEEAKKKCPEFFWDSHIKPCLRVENPDDW